MKGGWNPLLHMHGFWGRGTGSNGTENGYKRVKIW